MIAAVVTRGYGSFGSIPLVTVRGYLPGGPTPPVPVGRLGKKKRRIYEYRLPDGSVISALTASDLRDRVKAYKAGLPVPVERRVDNPPPQQRNTATPTQTYIHVPATFAEALPSNPNAINDEIARLLEDEQDEEEAIYFILQALQ